ncbi:nucleoside deaminase [Microbulbifer yueqingensis]|uniref:tRNA(Arg) A34 adenosine deaminase TadA n=1 Tax=Microbulbifer yueqingensis TaxID=658219 RepID=A0A1G8ZVL6_9GAMM|nr:nucleoside deaminase [Microbulbifer yueqingensis]SDK19093.1 tRNA(Arg) A34 adenosine deaminase TadA [Microbulbifer yueqingensis]
MTTEERHRENLARALLLADANVREEGGRPFGAVLVREAQVLAEGVNTIHRDGDPTAHAEIQAIRAAAIAIGSPRLDGAVMYASGHPCPMCLAAMYLCGISRAYYALSQEDGQPYGLSSAEIYAELARPPGQRGLQMEHLPLEHGPDPYARWAAINRKPG